MLEIDTSVTMNGIEINQIMPWYPTSHPLALQIQTLNELQMDHQTLLLSMAITLFNHPEDKMEIKMLQNNLRLTLYKYLCAKLPEKEAKSKLENIEIALNTLIYSQDYILLRQ